MSEQPELSAEEKLEIELGEQARLSSDSWDGVAPGKADNFGKSFGRMVGLLKPHAVAFTIVSVLGAIGVVLAVLAPRVLGDATNIVFDGFLAAIAGTGSIDFEALARTLGLVIGLYAVSALLTWVQGFVINIVMMRTMWRLREQVEAKINRLPLRYFDRVQRGELISRVTNDIDNITQTMQQSLSTVITSVLTVVGVLIMMFTISWKLALIALATLPLMGIIFGVIGPKSQAAFGLQWRKVGRLNARVEESFSGHALVSVYGQREATVAEFAQENEQLYRASFRAQVLSGIIMPAMTFVGNLSYVAIAVVGGVFVATGQLRIGDVQAFIQYSQQFSQPLSELGGMAAVVQSGTASAERVFNLLDEDEESPEPAAAPAPAAGAGEIVFQDVTFAYDPQKPLISGLSFQVQPGQTVAIVGPTGAGKTTLVNLLMRFYDLDGGQITVNGQNIAEITRQDARARTGMVLQDPWLFSGTIRENIRYGKQSASDGEIVAAAEATYVDRFVQSLPDGYDTVLDEEASNVSAGEKQLITIARAFLAQPSILILDEATSAVDTRTELLLQQAMAALRQGRTSFVIAHRLSTIRDADLILVMENGAIVEQGNHNELIAAQNAYWRLYQSQFEQGSES